MQYSTKGGEKLGLKILNKLTAVQKGSKEA
jgi:hypothetical protein